MENIGSDKSVQVRGSSVAVPLSLNELFGQNEVIEAEPVRLVPRRPPAIKPERERRTWSQFQDMLD